MDKQKQIAFTLRLPEDLKIQLDMIASKEDRSTNNLIVVVLKDYIHSKKKGVK